MTQIAIIGTVLLGLVMSIYLIVLARRGHFVVACSFLALAFALISVSTALLGLHLVYDIPDLVQVRALLALCAVPCLYLYFVAANRDEEALTARQFVHLLPLLIGATLVLVGRPWLLDLVLAATYFIYAVALVSIWTKRASHFSELGESANQTIVWLQVVISFLAAMLFLDVFISAGLAGGGYLRESIPLLLAMVALIALVLFSLIGALGRPSLFEHLYGHSLNAESRAQRNVDKSPSRAQKELAERARLLLGNPAILADDTLTITRLARKLGVPARQLSQAINRVHGCSFSDLLNDYRVELCKDIMKRDADRPLLEIMLDAGYVTKSNFYRQFSRRIGMTPAAYRSMLEREDRASAARGAAQQMGR